jgi:Co/Zn/Cd efflux system component
MENFIYSHLKSKAFWSNVVLIVAAAFSILFKEYPTDLWLGSIVSLFAFISSTYFQKQAVLSAAQSSVTLGKIVSGQN